MNEFEDFSTDLLEAGIEYKMRVMLKEVQRYAEITPEYIRELGEMCIELANRRESDE